MRAIAAVARREFAEHRMIVAGALGSGVLAALLPLLQSRGAAAARQTREFAGLFVGVCFAAGLALALGTSVVAGPIARRRLGFYFSRPLSAASIWGGKLAGAAALILAAEAAGAIPALAANGFRASREALLVLSAGLLYSVAVLLPLAHAVGIAARSRSRWLGLDLAGVTVVALAVVSGSRVLVRELALNALNIGLSVFSAIVVAALIAAGFAAISRGRTDLERAHRSLSTLLWGIALPAAALWLAYSFWVTSPSVGDLARIDSVSPAPRGELASVLGRARWRGPNQTRFLADLSTGRGRRLVPASWDPLFSSDGRRAVSVEPQYVPRGLAPFGGTFGGIQTEGCEVYRFDVENGSITRRSTGITAPVWPISQALSGDGSRLALAASESGSATVSVYDVPSGRLLGAAPIPRSQKVHVFFSGPDRARIYLDGASSQIPGELRVFEFDLTARTIGQLGHGAPAAEYRFPRVNPDATRLLLVSGKRIVLADAATAAEIAVLSSGTKWSRNAIFLEDGRIAVAEGDEAGTRVRLFSPGGAAQKSIPVGSAGRIALGCETASGKLVLSRRGEKQTWADSESLLLDLEKGTTRSIGPRLVPVTVFYWWNPESLSRRMPAGSPGSTLFLDSAGRLLRIDPETGERRILLPTS